MTSPLSPVTPIRSLAILDSSIEHSDTLLQGLTVDSVIYLDSTKNGIHQTTQILSQYQNLESVHFLTHGNNGVIQFGNTLLQSDTLPEHSNHIRQWGNALSQEADLLFYGCNVASNSDGLELLSQISQITEADVAASDDLTGHVTRGGDWQLEVSLGQINTPIAVSSNAQLQYAEILAVAPKITSNGGAENAVINVDEATTVVIDVEAIDGDGDSEGNGLSYTLSGVDLASLTIDSDTGVISFNNAPDFETPQDSNTDNIYEVTVTVTDPQGNTDHQNVSIQVDDVLDAENDFVIHLELDETSGTIASDTSPLGLNNPGTLQNGASFEPVGADLNGGVRFDGDNDYISIASSTDINLGTHAKRTIALWFKADQVNSTTQKQVLFEEGGAGIGRGLNIYIDNGALYVGGWAAPNNNWTGTFLSTTNINPDQWHHVSLVLDAVEGDTSTVQANVFTAYLDGVQFAQGDGAQLTGHGNGVALGAINGATFFHDGNQSGTGTNAFEGLIADAQLYNRALTATDIQALVTLAPPPSITSNQGEDAVILDVDEGSTLVTDAETSAFNGDSEGNGLLYILSGDDAALFSLDGTTGVLNFISAPDDQNPLDLDANNIYDITLTVTDSNGATDIQALSIQVDDVGENNDELVMMLNLDETAGSTAADTAPFGQGNPGTLQNGANFEPVGADLNGGVRFDGDNDYISIASSTDIDLGTHAKRTIALWFKADQVNSTTQKQVLFEEGGAGTGRGLNIYIDNGALYVGGWAAPSNNWTGTFLSTTNINPDQWHHVSLVLDAVEGDTSTVQANVFTAYLDGVQFAQGDGAQLGGHGNGVALGAINGATFFHDGNQSGTGTNAFEGLIADARLYNRALTTTDIQALVTLAPPPSITSNQGEDAVTLDVDEGTTLVTDTETSAFNGDSEGNGLLYTLSGDDAALFALDSTTGVLNFTAAPDDQNPLDLDANNIYDITLTVTDSNGATDSQALSIQVIDTDNSAPEITSNGGTETALLNHPENITTVIDMEATDGDGDTEGSGLSYSISGVDASAFTIDANTGVLRFATAPDFEAPADSDTDNQYEVSVTVTDSGGANDTQALSIQVDDVSETNDELVMLLNLDETAGTTAADTAPVGQGNPGTLQNGASFEPVGADLNGGVRFDGDNDYISIASSTDINLGTHAKRTIALWFKADQVNSTTQKQVLFEEGGAGTGRGLNIYIDNGALYVGGWAAPSNNWTGTFLSTTNINPDQWHHVSLVLDAVEGDTSTVQANVFTAYLDGVQFAQGDGAQLGGHGNGVALGAINGATFFHDGNQSGTGTNAFEGLIADAQLYNRALTATDIQALAAFNTPPQSSDPSITSNGGGATISINVDQNTTFVTNVDATDPDGDTEGNGLTYALTGPDAAFFTLDATTGGLNFNLAPSFEFPQNIDADNIYEVTAIATDSQGNFDTQALAIAIQNTTPGFIRIGDSTITANEADGTATVTVIRTNGSDGTITVDYNTIDVSATAGTDYTTQSGTLTFLDGETEKSVVIPIVEDTLTEGNEQFGFTIDNVQGGAVLLVPRTATVTIEDSDLPLYVPDFTNVSGLTLNGDATQVGSVIRLAGDADNQAGSVFFNNPLPVDSNVSFQSIFQFQLGGAGGTNGSNGLTFILHNTTGGATALGNSGSDMGYGGTGPDSLAIEFDTTQDAGDPDNNHISIIQNGDVVNAIATATPTLDINDGTVVNVWIDYNGLTDQLDIYLDNSQAKPTAPTLSQAIDLNSILGNQAFLGFSAGTSTQGNTHDLLSWEFNTFLPPTLPQGEGLKAEYYNNPDFTNLALTRIDDTVDFDWSAGSPDSGIDPDSFSVLWTGRIEPLFSETYTFTLPTDTDDTVKLWINDQLIIDSAASLNNAIDFNANQRYNLRLEYVENQGDANVQLQWSSASQPLQIVPEIVLYPQILNSESVVNLPSITSLDWLPDGSKMFITQKFGAVRIYDYVTDTLLPTPFIDLSDQVNGTRDRGLLDLAIDPDFFNGNPYVYLAYTYDPPEVFDHIGTLGGPDSEANRAARLTRIEADPATNYTTAIPGSEIVLTGTNSLWENFNGFINSTLVENFDEPPAGILADGTNLHDFLAADSESHTIGTVEFGPDGALYLSNGDGTSFNQADPRTFRVQDIDNLSGKVLRLDPTTGAGLPDNPFFIHGNDNIYEVIVSVVDSQGNADTQPLSIQVTDVATETGNQAPAITSNLGQSTASLTIEENHTTVLNLHAGDAEGDTEDNGLTYSLTGTDAALFTIDVNTGVLSFLSAPTVSNPGDSNGDNIYEVTVTVTDSGLATDTQALSIQVVTENTSAPANPRPVITSNGGIGNATINHLTLNENITAVADIDAEDEDGDTEGNGLTYSISGSDATLFTIDANTGELSFIGAPDYEKPLDIEDANRNRSKVYYYGLRNPFRMTIDPETGAVYIGDVGWTQWEELNVGTPGSNFGWPYYEGGDGVSLPQSSGYLNLPGIDPIETIGPVVAPIVGLNHAATGINAIVLGDIYDSTVYPETYQGDLFFNDLGQGIVRNVSFDPFGNVESVETFTTDSDAIVQIQLGPDGNLYYVDFNDTAIGRWIFG